MERFDLTSLDMDELKLIRHALDFQMENDPDLDEDKRFALALALIRLDKIIIGNGN